MDVERNARTQVLYREVNERIRALQESVGLQPTIELMCECGRACNVRLELAPTDYARVRDASTYFLVTPEHLASEADRMVEDHGSWLLVEAVGVAADIARSSYTDQSRPFDMEKRPDSILLIVRAIDQMLADMRARRHAHRDEQMAILQQLRSRLVAEAEAQRPSGPSG